MGNPYAHTPCLDSLARRGVLVRNLFVQNPVCMPSRACFFTGRYPRSHGVRMNGIALPESETTLADVFRAAGYQTFAAGKTHFRPQLIGMLSQKPKLNPVESREKRREKDGTYYGFEQIALTEDDKIGAYLDWVEENHPDLLDLARSGGRGEGSDTGRGVPDSWRSLLPEKVHQSTWIADRVIEFLEKRDPSAPFFVFAGFVDPHHPFNPPAPYHSMWDIAKIPLPVRRPGEHDLRPPELRRPYVRRFAGGGGIVPRTDDQLREIKAHYWGMVALIDRNIERIVRWLADHDLLDDTIIIFSSDHGELLGDHWMMYKGPFHYDCLIRVPMIWHWPAGLPQGLVTDALFETVDVMPTLLSLAGIEHHAGIQGIDQSPVLRGQLQALRDSIICEYNAADIGVHVKTIRTASAKLTVYQDREFGELYDLRRDPNELYNLYFEPRSAALKNYLQELLLQRLMASEDSLPPRTAEW